MTMDTTPYKNFRSTFVVYSCVQDGLVGENMSLPYKDKNTCDICVSSLWGIVCVENDLVGKKSFPHKDKHTSDTSNNSFYCFRYCAAPLG